MVIKIMSPFMTYHRVYNRSNTTGATSGAGTAYLSRANAFAPGFNGVPVALLLNVYGVFCGSFLSFFFWTWGRRGRDRMVVRFTTTYVIGACHH